MMQVYGNTTALNMHHITFDATNLTSGRSLTVGSGATTPYGVIHNCILTGQSYGQGFTIWADVTSGGWPEGNPGFGGANFLFIEGNTFTYANDDGDGALDTGDGNERIVFRYNTVVNTSIGWHGYDSNTYSLHAIEIYNNAFSAVRNQSFSINHRGGTAIIYNNTFDSYYPNTFTLSYYRSCDEYNEMCPGSNVNDENADASGWHCYHQPGTTGTNGITQWPTMEWNNSWGGVANNMANELNANFTGTNCDNFQIADGNPTTYDMSDHVKEGRDYIDHDTCVGVTSDFCTAWWDDVNKKGKLNGSTYTAYTCPHPLTGLTTGCDNDIAGAGGYNTGDITAPANPTYAINEAGSSFTVTFAERVTHGAGGTTGWVLTSDGGAVTATYSSGEGSTALAYQLSRTVYSTETVTGTYTQPTAGITDIAGNEFATVTDVSITNNSTSTAGAPTYPKMTLSTGSNVTLSPSGTGSFTLAP